MKQFDVPLFYRSPLISAIKQKRKEADKMKKPASPSGRDFTPTRLDFGPLQVYLARHFGFCYGVENAIDIAFRTVADNPGKRIFLLSEMIHNPQVNADLVAHGIRFLQDTYGKQLISFDEITGDDIVLIPAFGTTLDIEARLRQKGIPTEKYNTTCPFVEKVWNRSEVIARKEYTIIIHGKPAHEETRATFSHAAAHAPSVMVKDMTEAVRLAQYITGAKDTGSFYEEFRGQFTPGFDINKDLRRIGVVNQTTMLASDTQAIADYLKKVILGFTGNPDSFADTRDTLCYATNDNQTAVSSMLETAADLALVVGGYNSSNTSHLVELCEEKLPTYYISSAEKILSATEIRHYDFHHQKETVTAGYLPVKKPVSILVTSGASCPDAMVEAVIGKLLAYFPGSRSLEEMIRGFN
ncbi:MAG: 4-hydroxy-3-methylbut-2-enyl diphosphate reductase [Sphingobacteriales bacterium]|nr:4-hydroxy-3-methylbut-2-enyl diphosphate reductase [Sphingobacteriales bacterium]